MTDVAIAVPNLDQGRFLDAALESIWATGLPGLRVAVLDAGSTDESRAVIERHARRLAFWRSHADRGQAAAVNEGIARLTALFPETGVVGFVNADDLLVTDGYRALVEALEAHRDWPAASARGRVVSESGEPAGEYPVEPFAPARFARACTICQPATLVRREAWEAVGGLDERLDMSFDYDLWWKLARLGPIGFVDRIAAATRDHLATKTRTRREDYFRESMAIVRRHHGRVPWHWFISRELERRAAWRMPVQLSAAGRAVAGARAIAAYAAHRIGAPGGANRDTRGGGDAMRGVADRGPGGGRPR